VIEGELFKHRGVPPLLLRFQSVELRFTAGNNWQEAKWKFFDDDSINEISTENVEQISTTSSLFNIKIVDGENQSVGDFTTHSIICGFPSHSFCFIFVIDEDGMWSGSTISRSFGKLVAVPYRFDPS
jgi:hypothetical protein